MERIKWGIVTKDGKYVADPTGKTNKMAWTYSRDKADNMASLHDGKVVDVEQFVSEFNLNEVGK
jgi:hypothetical protein